MKLAKVLIVFKKSTFQLQALEHQEPKFIKLLKEGHSALAKVKIAHEEHLQTLHCLRRELCRRKIEFSEVARADLVSPVANVDLVISVGGDGTFLDTSHWLSSTPLLGVNSSRSSSFGHFCLANVDNLEKILDKVASNEILPSKLLRLDVVLNGSYLPELVLNEALICHSNPAATSRYYIEIAGLAEEQRSSGIWIGPPAGSTGALHAAGGNVLPITTNCYQYIVRESWNRPGQRYNHTKDVLNKTDKIRLISHMRTGAIYIDGPHISYDFSLGDELTVGASEIDLLAFIDNNVNTLFSNA